MTPGNILFTSVVLLALIFGAALRPAVAAQKGLILLGGLGHSVDLTYQFGRQDVSDGERDASSSQNQFQETYNLDTGFAIYNERLFKARISARARATQHYLSNSVGSSTSSNDLGLMYSIYGTLLERGYTPVKINASSEQIRIQNSFSPGYYLYSDSYGVGAAVRNKTLPISIDFTRYTSETSGLVDDRTQTNYQISLLGAHLVPAISQTDFSFFRTDSKSEAVDGGGPADSQRSFQVSLRNLLTSRDSKYALTSALTARQEVDRSESTNFTWQEGFSWRLGKALNMGAGYGTDISSQDNELTGGSSSRRSHSANFSLMHQLFLNLTTRFELNGRWAELPNGTEDQVSGNLSINYSRTLPRDGRISLSYGHLRSVIDRELTSGVAQAIDEPLTAQLAEVNLLREANVIEESIVVRDANPLIRFTPYVEGIDYTIDRTRLPFVGLSFINLPNSQITEGKNLLITYNYQVNPSIKYLTTAHSVTSTLLWGGRHRLYASYDQSGQERLSGRTDLLELNDSMSVKAGFASEIYRVSYGVENTYVDSTLDKHNSFESYARTSLRLRQGRLMGQVRNRYSYYAVTPSNPESRADNTFSITGNYTRPLFRNGVAVVNAGFTDTRGGAHARDDAELGLDYQWSYSKLSFKGLYKMFWRNLSGVVSLENYLSLEIRRYF